MRDDESRSWLRWRAVTPISANIAVCGHSLRFTRRAIQQYNILPLPPFYLWHLHRLCAAKQALLGAEGHSASS
jgi:hypothetical protein